MKMKPLEKRMRARQERRQENERTNCGKEGWATERRMQMLAREQGRDISEKVALGLAKPTQSKETMYDSRLFNQTSGFDAGFNEDQHYDKPLFAAQDAISSIYRPKAQEDDDFDDEGAADATMGKIQKSNRFEVLGKAKDGFKGAGVADEREGPVQFEKDKDDPFGIDNLIGEVTGKTTESSKKQKRYGLEEAESSDRSRKRARVDEEDAEDSRR